MNPVSPLNPPPGLWATGLPAGPVPSNQASLLTIVRVRAATPLAR